MNLGGMTAISWSGVNLFRIGLCCMVRSGHFKPHGFPGDSSRLCFSTNRLVYNRSLKLYIPSGNTPGAAASADGIVGQFTIAHPCGPNEGYPPIPTSAPQSGGQPRDVWHNPWIRDGLSSRLCCPSQKTRQPPAICLQQHENVPSPAAGRCMLMTHIAFLNIDGQRPLHSIHYLLTSRVRRSPMITGSPRLPLSLDYVAIVPHRLTLFKQIARRPSSVAEHYSEQKASGSIAPSMSQLRPTAMARYSSSSVTMTNEEGSDEETLVIPELPDALSNPLYSH